MSTTKKASFGCLLSVFLFFVGFFAPFFALYFLFSEADPWIRVLIVPCLSLAYIFCQKRFPVTSDIVLTILYGISLSKVIDLPIQAYTVAYYVFGVLFVIFFLIPSIIQTIERTRLFLLMFKQWSCPRYNTKQPLRLHSRVVVFYYFRRIASNFRSTNTLL